MALITRFEDMVAWQKARLLSNNIYKLTRKQEFSKDFELKNQIRSAAISTMSNIAEGFERGGNKEFMHFLSIAKASAGEVRSQLYVSLDEKCIDETEFQHNCNLCLETSKLIAGFAKYLQESDIKGTKFKTPTKPEL